MKSASARAARQARGLNSTRERILTSAESLFGERGFSSVTMPMLAEASGITAGAIYKHFDSKADLFFEIVRRAVQGAAASARVRSPSDALPLPNIVADYTTRRLKLFRQLAVEVHYAAVKQPQVRRLLRRSLDRQIQEIRDYLAAGHRTRLNSEFLACVALVFIMGLMHMETLVPRLVGDTAWHDFVRDRVAALLGLPSAKPGG